MTKPRHRITKVTTRQGDGGETRLADGSKVGKHDPLIAAIGDVDELNSQIGVLLTLVDDDALHRHGQRIQQELFDLGAHLATRGAVPVSSLEHLEDATGTMNAALPPLTEFVLPGGIPAAASAHVCRSVCRRAERTLWAAAQRDGARYLNRLSDYLFVLARALNAAGQLPEDLWRGISRDPS
jgi:cob(I)alamin adenosyltransferase